jgi:hypothetical protein
MQLGRAVLSSTDSTLEHAFGDALIWYESGKQQALAQALIDVSGRSNNDLLKSGEELFKRYSIAYSWTQTIQGLRKWLASL